MPNFNIGLSALTTSQHALEVISNNIANAGTEGYHRQRVHHAALPPTTIGRFRIQTGVETASIERIRNGVAEASLTTAISDSSNVSQLLTLERQIEAAFLNENTSLVEDLDRFYAEISSLSALPDESAQRVAVVEAGARLADTIREASNRLTELRSAIRFQLDIEFDGLNSQMQELSDLTETINLLDAQGVPANAELDQRDSLLTDIAERVGVSRSDLVNNQLNLRIGFNSISIGSRVNEFNLVQSQNGELGVTLDDSDTPIDLQSGKITALLEVYNSTLPRYQERLDTFARELMQKVDSVHATGLGPHGAFQNLTGTRSVPFFNRPLSESGIEFPVQAGELSISVTDPAGVRRTEVITIDPSVDTVSDVATRISSLGGLSANVNSNSGQLLISTISGYTFDFAGGIDSQPDITGVSGTSLPSLSGVYEGETNQNLTFEFSGSGEVGLTNDLFVDVYDSQGLFLTQLSIGDGYEAGTELEVVDGVKIAFSRGTVNDTEQFSTRVTAEPDETGVLAALGINSFFRGVGAGSIELDPSVNNDLDRFASGATSDSADTGNLFRFAALEDERTLPGGLTFGQYLNEITTEIGFEINANESLERSLESLKIRLEEDRDAYSGVDVNEELARLQQYQRSYEAAIRVIQVSDEILNELISIVN
ncbi:MAG: flagellar hook-associated protein FlgK [Planctomycetota bacterium]